MRGTAVPRRATPVGPLLTAYIRMESAWVAGGHHVARVRAARARDDRGEGVISAAIVVLIMAALGAAMWFAFNGMWENIRDKTQTQVDNIGGP